VTTYTKPEIGDISLGVKLYANGSLVVDTTPIKGAIGTTVRNGVQNPNWKLFVRQRIDASTVYTATHCNLSQRGSIKAVVRNDGPRWIAHHSGYLPVSPFAFNNCDSAVIADIANAKIKAKIASDKADFAVLSNLLEDVYEFRGSIYRTLDSIQSLLNGIGSILKHGVRANSQVLKDVAELWLSWSFGINPLISDTIALGSAIDEILNRKNHTKHFQAAHSGDCIGSLKGSYSEMGIKYDYVISQLQNNSCKFIAAIDFKLLSSNDYRNHFHLHPTDIIPMLWELLPWSWLIDYVTTAGAYLTDTFQSDGDILVYGIKNTRNVNSYAVQVSAVLLLKRHNIAYDERYLWH
jgi:hypothetical protein